jgi:catechol 2,3-dioxygenase-like lactoylglutathione lyase family enzyme
MITGIQHISYTVSDIDNARDFFTNTLGLPATPIRELSGERVEKMIGMPGIHMRISNIVLPDNGNIELAQYLSPKGKQIDLTPSNAGLAHLALAVDDLQKSYEELCEMGVHFVHAPLWAKDGALKGWGISRCYGPDGITIELMEPPQRVDLHPATGFQIDD